jgi:hypothetical protein
MKVSILSATAVAVVASSTFACCRAFVPPAPGHQQHHSSGRRQSGSRSLALNSAISARAGPGLPKLPNPYEGLPWNAEREERRKQRRLAIANAALFRELGLPEDATYEDVAARTKHLIDLTADLPKNEGIKRRIKIEIARDKIYQIRLNERISGVRAEQEDAARVSKLEEAGVDGL